MKMNNRLYQELLEIMNYQYKNNEKRNIFSINNSELFASETIKKLIDIRDGISSLTKEKKISLSNIYLKSFLSRFYNINQYIYFNAESKNMIKCIGLLLIEDLSNMELDLKDIEKNHLDRIQKLIYYTNPIIYNLNNNHSLNAKEFICSEYTGSFLIELLKIDIDKLKEPILDIGCGSSGNLVKELRNLGLEIYGFDIEVESEELIIGDWFTYDYENTKWGTIISNLSFTNHFLHHHNNNSDMINNYGKTYMSILDSLKIDGTWIYAPSIPFIEELLPKDKYSIERENIYDNFYKTMIIKLK